MKNKIDNLLNKDDKEAYQNLLDLEILITESNEVYDYFPLLLEMLNNDKSFVRVRSFRLICSLARWDYDNKIDNNIELILKELDDDKPTAVRQCLSKLNLILLYKPNLSDMVEVRLRGIDLSKYKDSMRPLIEKDINSILENL